MIIMILKYSIFKIYYSILFFNNLSCSPQGPNLRLFHVKSLLNLNALRCLVYLVPESLSYFLKRYFQALSLSNSQSLNLSRVAMNSEYGPNTEYRIPNTEYRIYSFLKI